MRRAFWLVACLAVLPVSLLGLSYGADEQPAAKPDPGIRDVVQPAPEVPIAQPVVRELTDYEDFTGHTEAATHVAVRARVTGFLVKVAFQDGAEVKEGDVLFEIDPRLYRAELDREEAAVGVAEVRLKVTESNHKRATALLAQNAISQEECDKAAAERDVAAAGVRLAKAQLAIAQLNLDRTRVVAPVSGRIGRRLVDPGNLVKADETNLASLVTHDPMFVYFDVDERVFLRMQRSMREGKLKTEKLPAAVGLVDENGFPHRGMVDFMDNCVDPKTGQRSLPSGPTEQGEAAVARLIRSGSAAAGRSSQGPARPRAGRDGRSRGGVRVHRE